MRILILGAGAVGVTLGVSLEHGKHEVIYLVRKGRKAALRKMVLVDARTGEARRRDAPVVAEIGARVPPFEHALLCVRGDQLDEGLAALEAHVRPDAAVGVASADLDALAKARAAHPGGPVFLIAPTFSAWSDAEGPGNQEDQVGVVHWFPAPSLPKPFPPLLPTLLSGEGDAKSDAAAGEVAAALLAVGVPARAVPSLFREAVSAYACGAALLGAWELSEWDADRLGKDWTLCTLAGRAAHQAAQATRDEASGAVGWVMANMPPAATALALMALPRVLDDKTRSMWRRHGPKIAGQTRRTLDEVIARAAARGVEAATLRGLRERLG